MSVIDKARKPCSADIDDENDSFHSFVQSDNDPSDFSCLTNIDDDDGSDEPELHLRNAAKTKPVMKVSLDVSPKTEALQKYAFTEIWIEKQQNYQAPKCSLNREFTDALDNYFNGRITRINQFANLSLDKRQKRQH